MKKVFHSFIKPVAVSLAVALPALAMASDFPTKSITLVVPFAPGGSVDLVGRLVAERLGKNLGQSVIVENKAGAATILAADALQKAPADGYTLMIGTSTTFVVNPIIYPKIPYNALTSFEPIGILGSAGLALLANTNSVKANNLQDLLKEMRAKPTEFSFGSHGNGSTVHFAAEMLWNAAKLKDVTHIPYKGSAPAITDLSGGQIPLAFDAIPAAAAAAKGGRVKILAVTSELRSELLPQVPTIAESGFPGFKMASWFAIVAPKGLPPAVQARLEKELAAAVADPALAQRLAASGFDTKWAPAAAYTDLVKADTKILSPIAKANNISSTD